MQVQFNYEGEQYIIGLPLRDRPTIFNQYIVEAYLLDWVPADEGNIVYYQSFDEAQRAISDLKDKGLLRTDEHFVIYKVKITRLNDSD